MNSLKRLRLAARIDKGEARNRERRRQRNAQCNQGAARRRHLPRPFRALSAAASAAYLMPVSFFAH